MRVGITGAAGFTGCYVAECLRARGHDPVSIDGDVRDAEVLSADLRKHAPDAIIHLAAKAFVQSDDTADFYAVNQVGTFNLLDAAAAYRPGMWVLVASSAQVYGAHAGGIVDERATIAPSNHYALSKAAMEMGAAWYRERLRLVVVRPFNYTGVGQEARYLLPKIVDHVRRADTIELGNIHVQRDFGDVRSVADAYCGLLDQAAVNEVVNVSTGRLSSIGDVLAILEDLSGHRMEVRVNPAFVRANDVAVLAGDNTRLRSILPDWRPVALRETLRWMLECG